MDISTAPSVPNDDDEPTTCDVCSAENSYVLYDGDKVCSECGHAPDGRQEQFTTDDVADPWAEWFSHRRAEYAGWYGEDRIKFVGGFASAY